MYLNIKLNYNIDLLRDFLEFSFNCQPLTIGSSAFKCCNSCGSRLHRDMKSELNVRVERLDTIT